MSLHSLQSTCCCLGKYFATRLLLAVVDYITSPLSLDFRVLNAKCILLLTLIILSFGERPFFSSFIS